MSRAECRVRYADYDPAGGGAAAASLDREYHSVGVPVLRARVRGCEQRHENEHKTCLGIEASSVSPLPGLASLSSRSKGVEIDRARTRLRDRERERRQGGPAWCDKRSPIGTD
jgi:hypothetical protein